MRVYSDLSKELSKSTLAQRATVRKKLEKFIPLHFGSQQLKDSNNTAIKIESLDDLGKYPQFITVGLVGCFADYLVEHLKTVGTGENYLSHAKSIMTELYPDFAKVLKDEGHAASRITFNLKKGVNNKVVHVNSNAADEGSPPDEVPATTACLPAILQIKEKRRQKRPIPMVHHRLICKFLFEKGDLMAMADRVILTLDMSLCGRITEIGELTCENFDIVWDLAGSGAGLSVILVRDKTSSIQENLTVLVNRDSPYECPIHALATYLCLLSCIERTGFLFSTTASSTKKVGAHINEVMKTLRSPLTEILRSSGLANISDEEFPLYTSHSYRHGAATHMLAHGLSIEEVCLRAHWMLEGSNQLNRYAHLSEQTDSKAARVLSGWSRDAVNSGYCPMLSVVFVDQPQERLLFEGYTYSLFRAFLSASIPTLRSNKEQANRRQAEQDRKLFALLLSLVLVRHYELLYYDERRRQNILLAAMSQLKGDFSKLAEALRLDVIDSIQEVLESLRESSAAGKASEPNAAAVSSSAPEGTTSSTGKRKATNQLQPSLPYFRLSTSGRVIPQTIGYNSLGISPPQMDKLFHDKSLSSIFVDWYEHELHQNPFKKEGRPVSTELTKIERENRSSYTRIIKLMYFMKVFLTNERNIEYPIVIDKCSSSDPSERSAWHARLQNLAMRAEANIIKARFQWKVSAQTAANTSNKSKLKPVPTATAQATICAIRDVLKKDGPGVFTSMGYKLDLQGYIVDNATSTSVYNLDTFDKYSNARFDHDK